MSLRKFISGVTAFAVAASAFAAMAVTASAENYVDNDFKVVQGQTGSLVNVNKIENKPGVYSLKKNPAGVIADLGSLTDIDKATSVTVEFDTVAVALSNGSDGEFAKIMYGVGNRNVRGVAGNGSSSNGYNKENLITYFGSEEVDKYILKDYSETFGVKSVGGKTVHATIALNRETGAYTTKLQAGERVIEASGVTDIGNNLTVIEAFTYGATAAKPYNITFKDIKVYYTVPTSLKEAAWDLQNALGYADDNPTDNEIKNGNYSIYGYYADINSNGITYTIKADLYADGAKNQAKGLELGNVSGTGDVTVFVITNAALNAQSRVYCE